MVILLSTLALAAVGGPTSLAINPPLSAAASAITLAQGENPKNMTFRPHLSSVSIFRDGYGFFVKEGKVKLENGWATANFLPKAIDGTVWVSAEAPGSHVDEVVATQSNVIRFDGAKDLKDKLGDKVGLDFTLTLNNGQTFTGRLNRLLDDMLLLNAGAGYSGIPYSNISKVVLDGFPLKVHVSGGDENGTVTIKVAYLQEGVRWQPSYVLDVTNGVGNLSLRASLNNTVQDFNGSNINFVVGSPFVTQRGMGDLLGSLPDADAVTQGASTKVGDDKDAAKKLAAADPDALPSPAPSLGAPTSVEEAGELYYYSKPKVWLQQGDVAMMTLFTTTEPVEPKFEWNADGDSVDYLLSFKNTMKQPLTTGPVMVIDGGKALGQNTLEYVPSGGIAHLKLAQGIGVRVTHHEVEAKRGGVTRLGKADYIPVTLNGTLKIENHRSQDITITVTKTIRGKVLNISDGGTVLDTQVLSGEPNTVNSVKWQVKVPAGGEKVLTYQEMTYMSADPAGAPPVPSFPADPTGPSNGQ